MVLYLVVHLYPSSLILLNVWVLLLSLAACRWGSSHVCSCKVGCVSQDVLKSMEEMLAGQGCRRAKWPAAGFWSMHLSYQTVRNRLHEGWIRTSCPLVRPTLTAWCNGDRLAFIRKNRPATVTSFASQMRTGSHWAHVTGVKESRDTGEHFSACNTTEQFGGGSEMVWGDISSDCHTYFPFITSGTMRYQRLWLQDLKMLQWAWCSIFCRTPVLRPQCEGSS